MKKLSTFFILLIAFSLLLNPTITFGARNGLESSIKGELNALENVYSPDNDISSENIALTIAKLIRSALSFIGIIMIALMIYAGFMWMTAAGNEEQIAKAKKIMTAAIIGAAIILASYIISYFIIDRILIATTGSDISSQTSF